MKCKSSSKQTPFQSSNDENVFDDFEKEETWDSEQIGAFARKLGFLDSKKADGEMVKLFLHVNEVCDLLNFRLFI